MSNVVSFLPGTTLAQHSKRLNHPSALLSSFSRGAQNHRHIKAQEIKMSSKKPDSGKTQLKNFVREKANAISVPFCFFVANKLLGNGWPFAWLS